MKGGNAMACMLTTVDNPYDPFTQFDDWRDYDESFGYFTCGLLARIDPIDSSSLTDSQVEQANEAAIDRIIEEDPFGIYIKVRDKRSTS